MGAKKVSFTAYSSYRLCLLHIIFVQLNGIQTNLKKRKTFESSITFVGQRVFVHEAIYQTEINIYFNNQMFLLINRIILALESNPLTPKIVTIKPICI